MSLKVDNALLGIKEYMPSDVYGMLVHILHWTDMLERITAEQKIDLNEPRTLGAVLTPFTGFGDPATWSALGPGVTVTIMAEVLDWLASGQEKPISLTRQMLVKLAPPLAALAGGPNVHMKILHKLKASFEE
jgi:hypothetical protein